MVANTLIDDAKNLYKQIPFASSTKTVNILHNLENIYIQAVIADERGAIEQSLRGIIRCKKALGQDSKTFEKEYAHYNFQPITKKQPKQETHKQETHKQETHKQKEKITPLENTKITTAPIKEVKPNLPMLKNILYKNGDLIINFSKALRYKDVLFFELNFNKKYKDIYDIKATLPKGFSKHIKIPNISRFAISQNNSERIRIVFEDKKAIPSHAYIKNNQLIIHTQNKDITITSKTTKKKKRKRQDYKLVKKYSKTIVIDPGHGGKDSGAVGYNHLQEKRTVLAISLKLRDELKKRGYRVIMTRSSDRFIDLKNRTHFANKNKADLFISIHANAVEGYKKYSVKGVETFYLSPARSARAKRAAAKENKASLINMDSISKNTLLNFLNRYKINQSKKLAIDVQSNILRDLRNKYSAVDDGAVRPAPFWVLVGAGMPAVLIETGYITNPTEAERLFNPFYQKLLAKGIADGIESYFYKN